MVKCPQFSLDVDTLDHIAVSLGHTVRQLRLYHVQCQLSLDFTDLFFKTYLVKMALSKN